MQMIFITVLKSTNKYLLLIIRQLEIVVYFLGELRVEIVLETPVTGFNMNSAGCNPVVHEEMNTTTTEWLNVLKHVFYIKLNPMFI